MWCALTWSGCLIQPVLLIMRASACQSTGLQHSRPEWMQGLIHEGSTCHRGIRAKGQLVVGFCFSFPVDQSAINSGTLIRWTKGYQITGAEGRDPVTLLKEAFNRQVGPGTSSPRMLTRLCVPLCTTPVQRLSRSISGCHRSQALQGACTTLRSAPRDLLRLPAQLLHLRS